MRYGCPNPQCTFHQKKDFIVRDGSYLRKNDSRRIARFKCKNCGIKFSNATFSLAKNQKKRRINHIVFKLLASGVSQRRAAKILKVHKTTIKRKFDYLSKLARQKHQRWLKENYLNNKVLDIQFDDLITVEHTKLRPLSVSTVVQKHTRKILGARVSQIGAFGHLAELSRQKYGKRKNTHRQKLGELFASLTGYIDPHATFESDEHKFYPPVLARHFPGATHVRYKGGRSSIAGQGELKKLKFDPLFSINHTYAMFRANINRLFRKTWCVTKVPQELQKHLDLYIYAFNTGIIGWCKKEREILEQKKGSEITSFFYLNTSPR